MPLTQWPSSRDYIEAIQNPSLSFQDPDLRTAKPAVDHFGMPLVSSGQFAYVFKLNSNNGARAQAVRCFRGAVGDREQRYRLINDHLNKVSAPYFASFEYDPEGMLVLGKRFPILVMEWIDGLPLDVYIPNILGNPKILKFLADLWLKILQSLRDNGMAHGDLQQGNIIVDASNSLRLVDLDGMFVPAMAGWKAAERGHRHCQHPKRSDSDFDVNLDNFSGLVIYLSLISLAETPGLWAEYHDENLILTKSDFENPKGSPLIAKIKRIGSEHRRLAEALEKACAEDPRNCPSVLELINTPPSRLPSWMVNAPTVTIQQTTREVKPGIATPAPAGGQRPTTTASSTSATSAIPSWHPSMNTASQVATAPPLSISSTTLPTPPVPTDLLLSGARQALNYAFIGVFLVWLWYPLLKALFAGMGLQPADAGVATVLVFVTGCAVLGYLRARGESKKTGGSAIPIPRPVTVIAQPLQPAAYRPPVVSVAPSNVALVGSRIRLIYHKPHCRWAYKISYRNRVQFNSLPDAKNAGYKPCGVCSP